MNLRNVLRAYSLLRVLNDDEAALLETLRAANDNERQLIAEAMADKPQKKPGKKSAGKGGGGGKSARASSLQQQIKGAATIAPSASESMSISPSDNDDSSGRCQAKRSDGRICMLLPDHNIHHMTTANEYHPFVTPAQSAEEQSTTGSSETGKAAAGDAHHAVSGGD